MSGLYASTRVFLLAILLASGFLHSAIQREKLQQGTLQGPGTVVFLEDWFRPFQGKSAYLSSSIPPAIWRESLTVGRLIASKPLPGHWTNESIQDLSLFIVLKSRQYEVSPFLVLSLIEVESQFRPGAISPRGAVGLMQLMPATAQELAGTLGMPFHDSRSLHDPKVNIQLGLQYVKFLRAQFDRPEHVLAAYNMGPAALSKKLKKGEAIPSAYYQKVLSAMETYKQEARVRRQENRRWL